MAGILAVQNPSTISAVPAAATPLITRRSTTLLPASDKTLPAAAPEKTKPDHGKSVKVVRSPAGRRYHCIHTGNCRIHSAERTSGVDSAIAAAQTAQKIA